MCILKKKTDSTITVLQKITCKDRFNSWKWRYNQTYLRFAMIAYPIINLDNESKLQVRYHL